MARVRFLVGLSILLLIPFASVLAQESSGLKARADELLCYNKPAEALPLYQAAAEQNPQDPDVYRNLGYVYELIGEQEQAFQAYQKGAAVARMDKDRFYIAMGRNLHKLERYAEAEAQYRKALEYNPAAYGVYLNRGNTRVKLMEYQQAINDYTSYLNLESSPSQEGEIRRMIALLTRILQDEEAMRLAEEARQLEEQNRQKALLDSVLSSLEDVTEDTQSLSAGAENIEEPDVEMELVE